jgi:AAA family ATP:ADP antiporter
LKQLLPGERRPLFLATSFFFFVLSGYYVLRPLRDEMGIQGGGDRLSLLFLGTLVGTLLLQQLLARLMSRSTRGRFVPAVYRIVIASLVLFSLALRFSPAGGRRGVASAFFVWVSIFVLFLTSLFWGLMADLFRSEQGKRLFGLIGAGGTAGGIAGSALTAGLVGWIGPENMILVAALLLELGVRSAQQLVTEAGPAAPEGAGKEGAPEEPPGEGGWSGIRRVTGSSYLLGICLFLLLYSVSSTFLYFEQARIVRAAFTLPAERAAFFARIDLAVNLLTLAAQMLLTSRILRVLGVGGTLLLLPLLTLAGFAALLRAPSAAVLAVVQTLRRSLEFSLVRPARELLFTVVSREEKYSSKSFIDTFVYRGGDAVGALVDLGLGSASGGAMVPFLLFLPVGIGWALLSIGLGRGQERRRHELEGKAIAP